MNHSTPARPIPPRAAARPPVQLQSKVFDLVAGGIDTMRALLDELPEQSPALVGRAVEQLVREELLVRDGARICRPGPSRPEVVAPPVREPPRPSRPAPPPAPAPAPVSRLPGAEVARRRAARGWSQADLARRIAPLIGATRGTAATYLSQLERGAWHLDGSTERARTWRQLLEQLLDPSADEPTTPHDDPAPEPAAVVPEAVTSGPSSMPGRRPDEGVETGGASAGASTPTEDLEPDPGPAEVATEPEGPIPSAPSALASTPPGTAHEPGATPAEVDAPASQPGPVGPCTEEEGDAGVSRGAVGAPGEADPPDGDRAGGPGGPAGDGGPDAGGGEPAASVGPEPGAAPGSHDGEDLEVGGRAVPDPVEPAPLVGWSTLSLPSREERAAAERGASRPGSGFVAERELAALRAALAAAVGTQGDDRRLVLAVEEHLAERDVAVEERIEALERLSAETSRRAMLERAITAGLPAELRRDLAGESVEVRLGALIGLARGGW